MDTNNSLFLRKKNFLGFRASWDDAKGRSAFLFFEPVNPAGDEKDKKDQPVK
jgi:hypothetical protein